MTNTITKFDEAYNALMVAKTIDEIVQIRDRAEMLRLYYRQQADSFEMQQASAEIRLRAERKAGVILKDMPKNKGTRGQLNGRDSSGPISEEVPEDNTPTLDDLGISYKESSQFQAIADIPEEEFETEIAKTKNTQKELTTRQLLKLAKEIERKKADEEARLKAADMILSQTDLCQLITGDFWEECEKLAGESIDVIITDPPYPKEFLNCYGALAEQAARLLKPGGSLLAMCGQSYLPDILNLMFPHLSYQWVLSYLTPGGQSPQIWQRKVNTFWKPVLWFVKGEYTGKWHGDVIKSDVNDNDKRYHHWGQSESGIARLVEDYSLPGNLILDPFCGGGTTGYVAKILNRRFIGIDQDPKAIEISMSRLNDAS